jgi:predicted Zn-dependent protease
MKPIFRPLVPAVWAALLLAACQHVPITGRSQLLLLSERDEVGMGFSAYQDVLKREKISHDPELNERVTRVGSRIAAATGKGKGKPPEFLSTHPADSTRIGDIERLLPGAMGYYRPQR